ncbi:MAG: hypothetical protein JG768_1416 [Fusobacteriales bacterium]|nr:hypothetical protein [Fusobacteriales bacterium]
MELKNLNSIIEIRSLNPYFYWISILSGYGLKKYIVIYIYICLNPYFYWISILSKKEKEFNNSLVEIAESQSLFLLDIYSFKILYIYKSQKALFLSQSLFLLDIYSFRKIKKGVR